MKAEILAVGTELLMGQIANTNAQYISNRLPDVGVGVYYHSVIGDNPDRLKKSLALALERADIVITTGGLGPTKDDLTKEVIAQAMNRKLVLHQESLDKIEEFFKRFSRKMTDNNIKQAYLPENSIIIRNSNGTAPGCIIEEGTKIIMMLPGPPSEMKPMFEETIIPYLREKADFRLKSTFLRIFGIGESAMEDKIIDLIDGQINPTIAPYAKEGEVTLRVTARYTENEDPDVLLKPVIEEIENRLGDAIYSYNNTDIDFVAGQLLLEKNITIATAESCTGGLLASRLTEVAGISIVFNTGMITYSNASKVMNLGVKQETLDKFGAVSREVAIEMAIGARKAASADLGLSITGIAGPGGGTEEKPVGLVYVALAYEKGTYCKELNLWGNRNRIRNVTCLHAFDIIRRHVLGLELI